MIEPRLAGGFRDYLPKDMIPRQKMFDTIRATFERFGFLPLDTPGVEREEILTGADPEFKKQIFRTSQGDMEDTELALRFDLTVPLARVVASYPNDIPRPFKRYATGKVWRGERQQAGRFREFVQFDADIVGSKGAMADAEIISLMYETMKALGFSEFLVRVNNRKILNGLAAYAGFGQEKNDVVLRAIDKLDKIEWKGVREELLNASGVGLEEAQADAIKRFLDLQSGSTEEKLVAAEALMSNSPQAKEGIAELREIAACLKSLGVPDDKWAIDFSIARGLGYYTGPVFETILTSLPSIGSVFSGGRYDDLVNRFSATSIPATGTSVGVDRLFAAMEKLNTVPLETTMTKAMVLNFSPECRFLVQRAAADLRRAGIPTEIYLGTEITLKAQLSAAVKQGIPYVVIIGDEERAAGKAQIKDMNARTQTEVPLAEVAVRIVQLVRG
jgi:histidyl-tRNA synthetase